MTVYETDVPGVGKKFELETGGDERLVVLIHHDGKREVYRRPDPDADSEKLFTVSGETARKLGSILEGAYFQPVETDEVQVPLGDAFIEWLDLEPSSELAGQTLGEADLRQETGVSVLAVQRDSDTYPNPDSSFELAAGDVLVTLGTSDEQDELETMLGEDDASSE
ncbi:potassium transporter TrkA [Halorientalis sp. IM1011]|uniref:cation:proton antiporter regulatory subunit n=1 Tax=Halorientalis sp. IM1011 TaxID=1932360 RepID=UPI00097CC89B|nr:TrkA C-terminal domain-containing protein [Halorientalis sp. IM1011]AQL43797.1 potassium transporter TrkA [Halorientalis sp. IM1011]